MRTKNFSEFQRKKSGKFGRSLVHPAVKRPLELDETTVSRQKPIKGA
jgi:hypothetical protein